jgi:catechol 2,3-dioxygenase-like lactoylglutathione lyase family enzyme
MPGRLNHFKVVLRCANLQRSREFYTNVLGFAVQQAWTEDEGRGCILALHDSETSVGFELYETNRSNRRFQEAFTRPMENDKVDLQLRTDSLDRWIVRLSGVWPFTGPEVLSWGQRWIKLRDPDNLLIALYEEVKT